MTAKRQPKDRPVMRYHGGKWRLAPWIISHFPKHQIYVEPFGGAASVLLQKPKSYAEVYNDMDESIVNVFRMLRDPEKSKELLRLIELTPYSRSEFLESYEKTNSIVENARRTIIRSFMGYSSDSATRKIKTGFRNNNRMSGEFASRDWANYPNGLIKIIDRLKVVLIENLPALEILKIYDTDKTLFYCDPPYLPETRFLKEKTKCYNFEMTRDEHIELLETLKKVNGMVIISGYQSDLYDDYLKGWLKHKKNNYGQSGNSKGSKLNTDVIWISPNTKKKLPLFEDFKC